MDQIAFLNHIDIVLLYSYLCSNSLTGDPHTFSSPDIMTAPLQDGSSVPFQVPKACTSKTIFCCSTAGIKSSGFAPNRQLNIKGTHTHTPCKTNRTRQGLYKKRSLIVSTTECNKYGLSEFVHVSFLTKYPLFFYKSYKYVLMIILFISL